MILKLVSEHDQVMNLLRDAALAAPADIWTNVEAKRVFAHLNECRSCCDFYDEMVDAPANEHLLECLKAVILK